MAGGAACFLLATVAGAVGMAVNDGSWTLVVIPLALNAMSIALYIKARQP